jgi:hypothetical protein
MVWEGVVRLLGALGFEKLIERDEAKPTRATFRRRVSPNNRRRFGS